MTNVEHHVWDNMYNQFMTNDIFFAEQMLDTMFGTKYTRKTETLN